MGQSLTFAEVFPELSGPGLSGPTARRVFDAIFGGAWTPAQIAGLLIALELREKSPEVVSAAAQALRAQMVAVNHGLPLSFDTCGTGGDGQSTLNVSTGAALIVAAAGVPVAKHGNRAASSRCGSADVLSALGISLEVPAEAQAEVLRQANIAFLYAPHHHPAMRFAGPPRRELGVRTLFNVLGPLANPARATHQLLGAFSDDVRRLMAAALRDLGITRAWVVHGSDGLDEISPFAATRVTVVEEGSLREMEVSPTDFGLELSPKGAIAGGEPTENAQAIERILAGEPHPAKTAFVLNAAAALVIARGLAPKDAAALARATLDEGHALRTLERWRGVAAAKAAKAPSP
jgi:anthranilate phosphoribosyltransferase